MPLSTTHDDSIFRLRNVANFRYHHAEHTTFSSTINMSMLRPLIGNDMPILTAPKAHIRLLLKEAIILRLHRLRKPIDFILREENAPWITAAVTLTALGDQEKGVQAVDELLLWAAEVLFGFAVEVLGKAVVHLCEVGLG